MGIGTVNVPSKAGPLVTGNVTQCATWDGVSNLVAPHTPTLEAGYQLCEHLPEHQDTAAGVRV